MAIAMLKAGIVAERNLPRSTHTRLVPEPVVVKDLPSVPFEEAPTGIVTDKKELPPPPPEPDKADMDDERPSTPRVRGRMVWLHKTAPVLEIEGKPGLTAEEMAAGRRR
jgi:hypothetical protein